jgi:hypothetical protein
MKIKKDEEKKEADFLIQRNQPLFQKGRERGEKIFISGSFPDP